jgi:serine/threonine protein kinase
MLAGMWAEVFMPRFLASLERVPSLDPVADAAAVATLWQHISEALSGLHSLGFAHSDVKPANICLDTRGPFCVLIDLDSAAAFGQATASTAAYFPSDVLCGGQGSGRRVHVASARADWWMLAMTLAQKACGDSGLPVGYRAKVWTEAEVRAHLGRHLPGQVWAALEGKLEG